LKPAIRLVQTSTRAPIVAHDSTPTPHACCSFFTLKFPFESNMKILSEFQQNLAPTWNLGISFIPQTANENTGINWYGTAWRTSTPETNSGILNWGMSVHHGGQYDLAEKKDAVVVSIAKSEVGIDPFTQGAVTVISTPVTLSVDL